MVKGALLLTVALGGLLPASRQATTAGRSTTKPFDHVHVAVTEPERAADWYVRMLGARTAATADRVWFGDVLLIFQKSAERRSGADGRVAHVAFSSPDVTATSAALSREGARPLPMGSDGQARSTGALLEDPWGLPIEIVEAPTRGLHHVHLIAADPAAALAGYERLFGGVRTRVSGLDALAYGAVLLLVQSGVSAAGPTAIDHISWRVENVDDVTASFRRDGVSVLREPGTSPGGNRVSFVEGPGGVRIEVMQRSR